MFETRSRARATIALQTIKKIEPLNFYSNAGSGTSYGFIAQPVSGVLGSAFSYHSSPGANGGIGTTLNYGGLAAGANGTSGSGIYSISQSYTNNAITINSSSNKTVMIITKEGDVEWYGKPSEAAKVLVRILQVAVDDSKGVTKAARRRYYYMACKNILGKAKTMDHDKFIDYLEKQVYNREVKIMWDALSNEQN